MGSVQQSIKKFREILRKYAPSEFLNHADFIETTSLLSNHPNWEKKKGQGILKIQVIIDQWKHKAFMVYRIDGSITDISFIIAARGKNDDILKRIKNACRVAIKPEIFKIKDQVKFGIDRCIFTNEILTRENTHIDHYDLSFNEVVNSWLKIFQINYVASFLNDARQDMVIEDKFTNQSLIAEFIKFHDEHTHLRAISQQAN